MMETSIVDLSVPVAVIVAESGRRGRRRQLVRRLRIAGTALAVAAVAFAGANAGLPLSTAGSRPGTVVDPAGRPAVTPFTAANASGAPGADVSGTAGANPRASAGPTRSDGPGTVDPSPAGGHRMLALAPAPTQTAMLPVTTATSDTPVQFLDPAVFQAMQLMVPMAKSRLDFGKSFRVERAAGTASVYLNYTDDSGPAVLELTMRRSEWSFPQGGVTPTADQVPFGCGTDSGTAGNHQSACAAGFLADGRWELIEMDDSQVPGIYGCRVVVWQPNGIILEFNEFAGVVGPSGKPSQNDRGEPPFDLATWRSITESKIWASFTPTFN